MFHDTSEAALAEEGEVMARGALLKVRFPALDQPNLQWFWVPLGNCAACRYYTPPGETTDPGCRNPAIDAEDFAHYWQRCDCPESEPGLPAATIALSPHAALQLDAMAAAHLVPIMPTQPVDVLQQLAWTPEASRAAHEQQEAIDQLAVAADAGALREAHVAWVEAMPDAPGAAVPWTPPIEKHAAKDLLRAWRTGCLEKIAQSASPLVPGPGALGPVLKTWLTSELQEIAVAAGPTRADRVQELFARALTLVEEGAR